MISRSSSLRFRIDIKLYCARRQSLGWRRPNGRALISIGCRPGHSLVPHRNCWTVSALNEVKHARTYVQTLMKVRASTIATSAVVALAWPFGWKCSRWEVAGVKTKYAQRHTRTLRDFQTNDGLSYFPRVYTIFFDPASQLPTTVAPSLTSALPTMSSV